jgi:hypothetical protein
MSKQEEWRTVPGFPDYAVSDHGRVASRKGKRPRILRPYLNGRDNYPYPTVTLHGADARQLRTVHSLVAEAFIGPRPDGLEVRHLNGDPLDARLSNIAYGTRVQNMQDRLAHGNHPMANKTHCKRNHEFTPDNTFVYRNSRSCRACRRLRDTNAMFRAAGISTERAA